MKCPGMKDITESEFCTSVLGNMCCFCNTAVISIHGIVSWPRLCFCCRSASHAIRNHGHFFNRDIIHFKLGKSCVCSPTGGTVQHCGSQWGLRGHEAVCAWAGVCALRPCVYQLWSGGFGPRDGVPCGDFSSERGWWRSQQWAETLLDSCSTWVAFMDLHVHTSHPHVVLSVCVSQSCGVISVCVTVMWCYQCVCVTPMWCYSHVVLSVCVCHPHVVSQSCDVINVIISVMCISVSCPVCTLQPLMWGKHWNCGASREFQCQ